MHALLLTLTFPEQDVGRFEVGVNHVLLLEEAQGLQQAERHLTDG